MPNEFSAGGSYTPQPKGQFDKDDRGMFLLSVIDMGEPGPSEGDNFQLDLAGGVYNLYSNGGTLGGGNIQVFEE